MNYKEGKEGKGGVKEETVLGGGEGRGKGKGRMWEQSKKKNNKKEKI